MRQWICLFMTLLTEFEASLCPRPDSPRFYTCIFGHVRY